MDRILDRCRASLLVFHGSQDPRPERAVRQLADRVAAQTQSLVDMAYLELGPLPLHQQIHQFALKASQTGVRSVQILPLFLLPGNHVMEDLPQEVALAHQALLAQPDLDVKIHLLPYLGQAPGWRAFLLEQWSSITPEAKILLAHGSRRGGSHQPVEDLATALGAIAAYWSVAPHLTQRVEELIARGCSQILVHPYFLFAGGITDALGEQVAHLALQYPDLKIQLAPPIGEASAMESLIAQILEP